jgi:TolB-like protein/class 3 adenylate cyclase/Tfp pilus assembly protein PilF
MSVDIEQRKLAAIMFTDMVGYSALSQRDDKLALELLEEHRQLLREIFLRFHGTEIKTIGDAFLIEFNSALEAARCGIEIQRALAKRNADITPDRRIELKIGIHIGDVVHRGGDVYGDGVNIASRIEPLAGAGGICVSMDVERQIRNAVETRFEKLAPTDLKNISVPMELFRIVLPWERQPKAEGGRRKEETRVSSARSMWVWAAAGVVVALAIGGFLAFELVRSRSHLEGGAPATPHDSSTGLAGARPSIPEKSIAVLPFENLSDDKSNAYFAEGIQDEILTRLSKIADLKVISRTSTQHYKSAPENLSEIGRQLGVAHLVEGSVQKSGDAVRVNVQLLKAADDSHLWAETYDRKLTDIFAVESEIAKGIADTLQARLSSSAKHVLASRPTENPEAHELYLKGRYFWNRRTAENLQKAADYFQQAIDKDPNYVLAYAGLADCHVLLPAYPGLGNTPRDELPKALAAARKAVELDDTLAEAQTSLARALASDLQLAAATSQFKRAIELNPNYATAHQWFGECLQSQGKLEEGLAELKRAQELDPLSLVIGSLYGFAFDTVGKSNEAIAQLRKTIEIDPNYSNAHGLLGVVLEHNGRLKDAIAEYEENISLHEDAISLSQLAGAYFLAGKKAEAQQLWDKLKALSDRQYVPAYSMAVAQSSFGNHDEAISLLEKSYEDHAPFDSNDLGWILVDHRLDPLRSDPRFKNLVTRIFSGEPR